MKAKILDAVRVELKDVLAPAAVEKAIAGIDATLAPILDPLSEALEGLTKGAGKKKASKKKVAKKTAVKRGRPAKAKPAKKAAASRVVDVDEDLDLIDLEEEEEIGEDEE